MNKGEREGRTESVLLLSVGAVEFDEKRGVFVCVARVTLMLGWVFFITLISSKSRVNPNPNFLTIHEQHNPNFLTIHEP